MTKNLPFVLDLTDEEWRYWEADKLCPDHCGKLTTLGRCGFNSVETFRAFCALADIDPDQGRGCAPFQNMVVYIFYIWMSRTKDLVFETYLDPLSKNGYCHFLGVTGGHYLEQLYAR